jgi:hypothetical protein
MQSTMNRKSKRTLHIVYDTHTGDVVHLRGVTVFPGAKEPSDEDVAARALEAAARLENRDFGNLAVIRTDPASFLSSARYRVDVDSKTLIVVE